MNIKKLTLILILIAGMHFWGIPFVNPFIVEAQHAAYEDNCIQVPWDDLPNGTRYKALTSSNL
ncbi:MAG: hypothetical protein Pg6B_09420 [Candidatus Azobacteroides pseudotrichonymphae]|jgi:hypothetical protein|nr:MAG: hypothetical protein Pg6B_09420 [Candidatus Azobacteroides pseudotrichonymphae]